jgi:outer membrane protein insertion porin family
MESILVGMRVRLMALAVVVAIAVPTLFALAQENPPGFSVNSIAFRGSKIPRQQLLAFTGLHPGQSITQAQMQAASDKLTASGLFTAVHFTLENGQLVYSLTPSPGVLPVVYDNFPWWSSQALNAAVAARVPLFFGEIYGQGPMRQQVASALQALLAAKGIHATISASDIGDQRQNAIAIRYVIDSPRIVIASLRVSGYASALGPPIHALEQSAAGRSFSQETLKALTASLRSVYVSRGYLNARLSPIVWNTPKVSDGEVQVALTDSVTSEGGLYKVSAIRVAPNPWLSAHDLQRSLGLHPGQIADASRLQPTLDLIREAYVEHGYVKVVVDPHPTLEAAHHTVAYDIGVQPGAVYRMGQLTIEGLNKRQTAKARALWPMHRGDVFNPRLMKAFLPSSLGKLGQMQPVHFDEKYRDDHTVQVLLVYGKKRRH